MKRTATRGTYADHGAPELAYYFGTDRKQALGHGRLVTLTRAGARLNLHNAVTGDLVAELRTTNKIWLSEPVTATAAEVDAARITVCHLEAKHDNWWHRMTSGREKATSTDLAHSFLYGDRSEAGQRGDRALVDALTARMAELDAVLEAERIAKEEAARVEQVVIVPCGGKKLDRPAPAGKIYSGSYHAATRRAAATIADANPRTLVLVLSAKHGLLRLQDVIEPYDLRMGQQGSATPAKIARQAARYGITDLPVTVLAGRAYADAVTAVWPDAVRTLDGTRGIGDQLARLSRIAAGQPAVTAAAAGTARYEQAALFELAA